MTQKNHESDWSSYLGDNANTHSSNLKQIDTLNIGKLQIAWVYHTGDIGASGRMQECNPLIIDGIMYGTTPKNKLFAIDASNGEEIWKFDPFDNEVFIEEPSYTTNRGVSFLKGKNNGSSFVFFGAGNNLYKVSADSGRLDKHFGENGRIDLRKELRNQDSTLTIGLTTPGVIYKDLLIIGSLVSESNPAASGDIRAYNVHSGKLKWAFHTIPRPGEPGYETWEDKDSWKVTGGANAWAGLALDEEEGVAFAPTGSATFDFYGGLRKGKNLYANSLLAIDAATGRLQWSFQTVHHDLWDRDLPSPPNLVTVERAGKTIKAVAQTTKTGYIFLFNRKTGEPLFEINEVQMPTETLLEGEELWPTQPVPILPKPFTEQYFGENNINSIVPESSRDSVRAILNSLETNRHLFQPPSEKGIVIFPGFDGGAEWGGSAYDDETKILYVNSNQIPWYLKMVRRKKTASAKYQTLGQYGREIYLVNCAACHGKNKEGAAGFPSLQSMDEKYSVNSVKNIVEEGRGRMPAFKALLTEEDKHALISYLMNLKEGGEMFTKEDGRQAKGDFNIDSLMPYDMTGYHKIQTPEGYPGNEPPWGTLSAINLNTGQYEWQIPLGEYPELKAKGIPLTGTENYGGPVITKGGLLFIAGTLDKKIRAFNKRNGKLLWEGDLPTGGFATPSTYMVNGKQYVVIACGGGRFGNELGDSYVAFSLP